MLDKTLFHPPLHIIINEEMMEEPRRVLDEKVKFGLWSAVHGNAKR